MEQGGPHLEPAVGRWEAVSCGKTPNPRSNSCGLYQAGNLDGGFSCIVGLWSAAGPTRITFSCFFFGLFLSDVLPL